MANESSGSAGLSGFNADGETLTASTESGRDELTRISKEMRAMQLAWILGGKERNNQGELREQYAAEKKHIGDLTARLYAMDGDFRQGQHLLEAYRTISALEQTPIVAERKAELHAALMASEKAREKAFKKGWEPSSTPTEDYSALLRGVVDQGGVPFSAESTKLLTDAKDSIESVLGYLESDHPVLFRDYVESIRKVTRFVDDLVAGRLTTEDDFVTMDDIHEEGKRVARDLDEDYLERGSSEDLYAAMDLIFDQASQRAIDLNW
jgi:hypothetical protein